MSRFVDWMHKATAVIEVLVALALVAIAAGAVASLAYALVHSAGGEPLFSALEFNTLIDHVLEVFIVIELFRITIAYMTHVNVVPTVLEAALVAIARKFVVVEPSRDFFLTALGLSALLLSVALTWWLLNRARVGETAQGPAGTESAPQ